MSLGFMEANEKSNGELCILDGRMQQHDIKIKTSTRKWVVRINFESFNLIRNSIHISFIIFMHSIKSFEDSELAEEKTQNDLSLSTM
uniref:Uncharacterized protein n=1 Tax=Heterorhabditis bacteriophora TaxID=37862 RepID=A0A1I7WVW9_HETBA